MILKSNFNYFVYLWIIYKRLKSFIDYPQIYKGGPRPCMPPCVVALSAMGLKLGVFEFLPTKQNQKHKANACTIFVHYAA